MLSSFLYQSCADLVSVLFLDDAMLNKYLFDTFLSVMFLEAVEICLITLCISFRSNLIPCGMCRKSRQTLPMVATGISHAVLLRTDGKAVAFGNDPHEHGYLNIPPLPAGLRYTQVSAGSTPVEVTAMASVRFQLSDKI